MTAFVKRSVSSVQSVSSLSFSSLVFSSPSRREAATKQRVTNQLLTVKSASGKTYSPLAAETGLKRRTSWESVSLSSPQSLILFVNPQAKVLCFGISLDRLNMFSAASLISLC
ncbi:hypothetical protein YC2023_056239 [Brassica napus]